MVYAELFDELLQLLDRFGIVFFIAGLLSSVAVLDSVHEFLAGFFELGYGYAVVVPYDLGYVYVELRPAVEVEYVVSAVQQALGSRGAPSVVGLGDGVDELLNVQWSG